MQQRERFIADHLDAPYTMTELCAHYGISRRTGYKWIRRFEDEGRAGLADRSHAPHRSPHKISARMAALLLGAKRSIQPGGRSSCSTGCARGSLTSDGGRRRVL
jgi:putative transposase